MTGAVVAIATIAAKEFTEYRRDGRVAGIAGLIALLVFISLLTGWSTHAQQQRQAQQAQWDDQATFLNQGEKTPHAAAHFGRMAYKTVPPLAVFDPGATPYLGQVIWLEAHARDPAMFRPAEDAPDLRRLADLSVAGILTLLLPLLIFLIGHGAFAGERERGTLRQVLSSGPDLGSLFAGKFISVAAVGAGASLFAITVSAALAVPAPGSVPIVDTLTRSAWLMLGYGVYSVGLAAIALFVSARARSATSALVILLSLWTVVIVILPKLAAGVAEHIYPAPDAAVFWAETADAIRADRPDRGSEQYRALEQQVLSRALGRDVTAEEAASMDLNRFGLSLEISELQGGKAYADAYRSLHATYANQQRIRRLIAVFSPAIALQHLSSALAGTDVNAHRHFASEAEKQRNVIVRTMNEDLMLNGAGQSFYYLAGADFWKRIPDFVYRPPPVRFALRHAIWDFLLLSLSSAAAFRLSWKAARRQAVV